VLSRRRSLPQRHQLHEIADALRNENLPSTASLWAEPSDQKVSESDQIFVAHG
jgi:hypothetical protein